MALSVTSAVWQQVNSPALDIRRFVAAGKSEGVVAAGDMAVAQRASGANFSVDVAAGEALVTGDTVTNQSLYYVYNDAVANVSTFSAAHASLPRIDRVTLRVRDAFHGDAANDMSFQVVTGTPTSGATLANLTGAAAVPASSLLLANVLIPATATTITTANIDTTVRPRVFSLSSIPAGTNGQVITTTGGAVVWGTIGTTYVTSLPGSPTDGQEAVLVDSTTSPTYQWRFRYNSGSSNADKWEFVGGTPAMVEVAAGEATASATYVALTTAGPTFTLPRAGVYLVEQGFTMTQTVNGAFAVMSYDIGATGAVDADATYGAHGNPGGKSTHSRRRIKTGLTAAALTSKYKGDGTNSVTFLDRWLSVTPVRVS